MVSPLTPCMAATVLVRGTGGTPPGPLLEAIEAAQVRGLLAQATGRTLEPFAVALRGKEVLTLQPENRHVPTGMQWARRQHETQHLTRAVLIDGETIILAQLLLHAIQSVNTWQHIPWRTARRVTRELLICHKGGYYAERVANLWIHLDTDGARFPHLARVVTLLDGGATLRSLLGQESLWTVPPRPM